MLRIVRGMSLKQVAEATAGVTDATGNSKGLSAAYVHQLETGKIDAPSPHNLYKLSQALSFPYPKLMELAGYSYDGNGSAIGDQTASTDRFAALAAAVAETEIPTEGKQLLTGAIREYELCWKAGVEPPPALLGNVLREYHRIHEAGVALTLDDISATQSAAA